MIAEGDYVAIFHSIHRVMKAEKILKSKRAPILLVPIPRQLTSDCGLALRYTEADREQVEGILEDAGLPPVEVFCKRGEEFLRC